MITTRQFLIWIQTKLSPGFEIWACPEIVNMKTGLYYFFQMIIRIHKLKLNWAISRILNIYSVLEYSYDVIM